MRRRLPRSTIVSLAMTEKKLEITKDMSLKNKNRARIFSLLAFAAIIFAGGFLSLGTIQEARALDLGINAVDETIQLSSADPRVIIAGIIRTALGLLGIVTLIFILYGGFMWMTAGGETDKIDKAKRMLMNAVIGLVIILTSFAITQFVLNRLLEATLGGGGGGGGGGGCPPGEVCPGGLPTGSFVVQSINPQDPAPPIGWPRNSVVRIRMNQGVDEATVPGNVTVRALGTATDVPGNFNVQGSLISFTPSEPCPEPNNDRYCFDSDTTFRVEIANGLRSSSAKFVVCGGLAPNCSANFTIGNYIDVEPPQISISTPVVGQSIPLGFETVRARATDDSGVSEVEAFDGGASIGVDSPNPTVQIFDASMFWDTASLGLQSCRAVSAIARDVDTNETRSADVPVVIRAAHCFDGQQNNDETGIDCGGDPQSIEYCGKCAGEACVVAPASCVDYCRSASCIDGICVDRPRIDGFDPDAAGPGSYVTISGEFFGTNPGTVVFMGTESPTDDVVAELAPCASAWSSTQIVVVVPSEAVLAQGPIMITATNGQSDTTTDAFTPTEIPLPGICAIISTEGRVGDTFTLQGNGFGEIAGDSIVHFVRPDTSDPDDRTPIISSWGPTVVAGQVPVAGAGPREVYVTVGGLHSNRVDFDVLGPETGATPFINDVLPATGPIGTYITLLGANFGSAGQVIFTNNDTQATALGGIDFPEACTGEFWRDDQVTVKVPPLILAGIDPDNGENLAGERLIIGDYTLQVRRAGIDEAVSNTVPFGVVEGTAPPGICGMSPVSGPENAAVRFFGEGFGEVANTIARFFENKIAASQSVTAEEVQTRVPTGAETGIVLVQVNELASNPRNFRVADCRQDRAVCTQGYECCIDGTCALEGSCSAGTGTGGYAWYVSTGQIPQFPRLLFECSENSIPTPAPISDRNGGDAICVNAIVSGRFSIEMDTTTITSNAIILKSCTGTAPNLTCDGLVDADLTSFSWSDPPICSGEVCTPGQRSGHGFRIIPEVLLSDTWYEVKIANTVRGSVSSGRESLSEDAAACGAGFAYCWRFKTRNSIEACAIESLQTEPQLTTATAVDQKVVYDVFARGRDACVMLNTSGLPFEWRTHSPD
ncbi:MAG: IPT/TIG domain-containing protein, partial [bacterium]|nr:IPT/TIG domain-containing protein [bacterium]